MIVSTPIHNTLSFKIKYYKKIYQDYSVSINFLPERFIITYIFNILPENSPSHLSFLYFCVAAGNYIKDTKILQTFFRH